MATSQLLPYHLQQLAQLCDEYPLIRKLVFVPSRRTGHKLAGALVRSGRQWVNLHLTTPYEWAKRQVEPVLKQEGWREVTAGADLMVIESLVRDMDLEADLAPETLARTAAATLPALRLAGVEPADVWEAGGPEKVQQLVETLGERYSEYLTRHQLYDEAAVYDRALEVMPQQPAADLVCGILDEVELSGKTFDYVRAVSDRSPWPLRRIGRTTIGVSMPSLSAGRRLSIPADVSNDRDEGIGIGGFLWCEDLPEDPAGNLRTEQVLGSANEIRTVLRQMQQREISCDEVELVYTSESDYLRRIYSLLTRHNIPATFSGGLPVNVTRPGAALTLFYEWIESNFDPTILIQLLASGSLERISDVDPKKAATILRKAQPARGEDQCFAALAHLERRWREEDERDAHDTEEIRRVRSLLRRLFALVPDRETSATELAQSTQTFLDVFVKVREDAVLHGGDGETPIDDEAVETLVKRFTGLAGLVSESGPRHRLVRQFREQLVRHKVADSSPHPGCLHVSDLHSAGYTNRRHVFIIGLDQSVFPGGSSEDPLLLDHMRREISEELPPRGSTPAEVNWHLVRVLGMCTGEVTMLCSRRSLVDDRPLHPSAAFLRAADMVESESSSLSLLPALAPDVSPDAEWLAQTLLTEGELGMALREFASLQEIMPVRYPWLSEGRRAQQQRASDRLTTYDGVLSAPDRSLVLNGRTLSASRLETLMTCTYRYFLQYVLNVEPVEELTDRDRDRWLDGRDFGSLLHRLFRRFMQEVAERDGGVDRDRDAQLMEDLLQDEVERQIELTPPPNEAARRRDVERLRICARIFLAAEEDHCRDHSPAGFEVSFGREGPTTDGLGQSEPILLNLSDDIEFRLQGSIDRVDTAPDGSYAVWDYKTGSTYEFDEYDLFSGGKKLQWALYAHALTELTGQGVSRSGYFFPTGRTYGQRIAQEVPEAQDTAQILEPLFEMVEQGLFLPAASREHCAYCDYQGICGDYGKREREMRRKLGSDSLGEGQKQLLQQWNYHG